MEPFRIELGRTLQDPYSSGHYRMFLRYAIRKYAAGEWGPDRPLSQSDGELIVLSHPRDRSCASGTLEQYEQQIKRLEEMKRRPVNGEVEHAYWDYRLRSIAADRQRAQDPNWREGSRYTAEALVEVLVHSGVIKREVWSELRLYSPDAGAMSRKGFRPCLDPDLGPVSTSDGALPATKMQATGGETHPHLPPAEVQQYILQSPRVLRPAGSIPGDSLPPAATDATPSDIPGKPNVASGEMPAQSEAPRLNRPVAAAVAADHARLHKQAPPKPGQGRKVAATSQHCRGVVQLAAARPESCLPMQPKVAPSIAKTGTATLPVTVRTSDKRALSDRCKQVKPVAENGVRTSTNPQSPRTRSTPATRAHAVALKSEQAAALCTPPPGLGCPQPSHANPELPASGVIAVDEQATRAARVRPVQQAPAGHLSKTRRRQTILSKTNKRTTQKRQILSALSYRTLDRLRKRSPQRAAE